MKQKKQKEGFLGMLLDTLGASLLRNLLTGRGKIRAGEGSIRAGLILLQIVKYKSIIKMKLNIMVSIQKIIYLK